MGDDDHLERFERLAAKREAERAGDRETDEQAARFGDTVVFATKVIAGLALAVALAITIAPCGWLRVRLMADVPDWSNMQTIVPTCERKNDVCECRWEPDNGCDSGYSRGEHDERTYHTAPQISDCYMGEF